MLILLLLILIILPIPILLVLSILLILLLLILLLLFIPIQFFQRQFQIHFGIHILRIQFQRLFVRADRFSKFLLPKQRVAQIVERSGGQVRMVPLRSTRHFPHGLGVFALLVERIASIKMQCRTVSCLLLRFQIPAQRGFVLALFKQGIALFVLLCHGIEKRPSQQRQRQQNA